MEEQPHQTFEHVLSERILVSFGKDMACAKHSTFAGASLAPPVKSYCAKRRDSSSHQGSGWEFFQSGNAHPLDVVSLVYGNTTLARISALMAIMERLPSAEQSVGDAST